MLRTFPDKGGAGRLSLLLHLQTSTCTSTQRVELTSLLTRLFAAYHR